MLPFLNKDQLKTSSAALPVKKAHDESSYDMLDAIAEDLSDAIERKDKGLLKEALKALCEYVLNEDDSHDQSLEE